MKKTISLSLCSLALLLFTQIEVHACGCIELAKETRKQMVNRFLETARVVFTGEVIEITKNPENPGFTTKIKVEKWWKQSQPNFRPKEITLFGDGSSCEYHFAVGKKYLVFANEWKNKLQATSCSGNSEIEKATEELKLLGKGKKPRNG
jgi:hypothetical protein